MDSFNNRTLTLTLLCLVFAALLMTYVVKTVYASPKYVTLHQFQIEKAVCKGPKDAHGLYYNCWVYANTKGETHAGN